MVFIVPTNSRIIEELQKLTITHNGVMIELKKVRLLLDKLIDLHNGNMLIDPDMEDFLSLPQHQQKTIRALKNLPAITGTAQDVARITHRARAVESMNLNRLVERGFVAKSRVGKKAFFTIKKKEKNIDGKP